MLERRFNRDYGRRERLEIAGDETAPLIIRAAQQLQSIQVLVVADPSLTKSLDDAIERLAAGEDPSIPGRRP